MSIIKDSDILGYFVDEECVCRKCINKDEERNITEDDIIAEDCRGVEDRYFCDRCKKEI